MLPLTGAIWSCAPGQIRDFPARYLIRFFANHGMLTVKHAPAWKTVSGGSRTYVERRGRNGWAMPCDRHGVAAIERDSEGVTVTDAAGAAAPLRPGRDRHPPRPGAADAGRPDAGRAAGAGQLRLRQQRDGAAHRRLAAAARGGCPRLVELPARGMLDDHADGGRHLPPEPAAGPGRARPVLRHAEPEPTGSPPAPSSRGSSTSIPSTRSTRWRPSDGCRRSRA